MRLLNNQSFEGRDPMNFVLAVLSAGGVLAAGAALAATAQDRAFVAMVGQGGMFEVEAGKLAETKAFAVDVHDFAVMEVHDHMGVGDRLKSVSSREGVPLPDALNAEFQSKLDHLRTLSGAAFDSAYMEEMSTLHAKDGAAFAKEGQTGGSPDYRAFGLATHRIVERHIGAIHGVAPPSP
jgi:putative membrane protein